MQTLLNHLNAVPGVVGTLVCGPDGQLIASAFPPVFDEGVLSDVAKTVAESTAGLGTVTGSVRMLDLRHANARIVARPVTGAVLLFLCSPSMNLQPLDISASVAVPRIERLVAQAPAGGSRAAAAPAGAAPGSKLHALVQRINRIIERKQLDPFATRGEIALEAGFGLGFIDSETPDDPDKLSKLKAAASAVLGETP
jgi:predicted regulator of Ras-like GTPase activity (Roadblock/LC7/MglB family)